MLKIVFILLSFFLIGCTSRIKEKTAKEIVQARPEVQNFLTISKEAGDKTHIIAEEHRGHWEVGVYVVLPDHMSTFNSYNLDHNGHLVSFRDKYDEQGNFICSIATEPSECK